MRGAGPAFFLALQGCLAAAASAGEPVGAERGRELVRLVRNDCGSCHGARLSGGLGPSLLPPALRGKAPDSLRETILRGRAGTAMPPWSGFMSADEADWVVQRLMDGFPDAR